MLNFLSSFLLAYMSKFMLIMSAGSIIVTSSTIFAGENGTIEAYGPHNTNWNSKNS